jgi:hypothetical protein
MILLSGEMLAFGMSIAPLMLLYSRENIAFKIFNYHCFFTCISYSWFKILHLYLMLHFAHLAELHSSLLFSTYIQKTNSLIF